MKLTRRLTDEEIVRLAQSTRETIHEWIEQLRWKAGGKFPERVTAFHPEMAVHGRLLADRALSRLLHADWPKTIEELEAIRGK